MLNKCIGIVSYFPEEPARTKRIERFNQLLKQINNLWPSIDLLIIAQNWKDYQLPIISNKIEVNYFDDKLGIWNARFKLREKFLASKYDYLIMLDDDAIINDCSKETATKYLEEIDSHPDQFCFIHDKDHWHKCDDYIKAPLNLCAISKFIYRQEAIPQVELEKNEALEDDSFAVLLHIKYGQHEFLPPEGIKCTHATGGIYYLLQLMGKSQLPSTWYNKQTRFNDIIWNTNLIIDYIVANKDLNLTEVKKNKWWKM